MKHRLLRMIKYLLSLQVLWNSLPIAECILKLKFYLDFGMAGFKDKENLLRGRCGTPGYVAPDILKAGVHEGYPLNVDMFSIGVVIYTLLCGYEPFYGTDDAQLIKSNKNVNYEFHLPEWSGDSEFSIFKSF